MSAQAWVRLLVFPGLVYALATCFAMGWLHRKLVARAQGRIGPPFYQPFFDVIKLAAKTPVPRPRLQAFVMAALPTGAIVATLGAAALLPVLPGDSDSPGDVGFRGDLVLLVALLEVGPLLGVLAGYVSRSLWGGLGASREAVMAVAYNLPFLIALVALAQFGGLSVHGLATQGSAVVRVLALAAILLCLPAKLHLNPFSVADAEQEIYTGVTTEYDGPRLALWHLAHLLEWPVLAGLVAVLAFPVTGLAWPWHAVVFVLVSFVVVVGLSLVASSTARLKLAQAARWFWLWGSGLAACALGLAMAGV